MHPPQIVPSFAESSFELRFVPTVGVHPTLAFACDASGDVDIDGLSEPARRDYLFAHMLIGRDYEPPLVCRVLRGRAAVPPGADADGPAAERVLPTLATEAPALRLQSGQRP